MIDLHKIYQTLFYFDMIIVLKEIKESPIKIVSRTNKKMSYKDVR